MEKVFDWFIKEYPQQTVNIHSNSISCHLVTQEPSRDAETVADLALPVAGGTYEYQRLLDIDNNSSNRVKYFAIADSSGENDLLENVDSATNTLTLTAHGLSDNHKILITPEPSSVLPTGITSELLYVVNSTANNFQVSTSKGGSALDFTDDGTGTFRLHYREGIRLGSKFIMQNPLWVNLTTGDNAPIVGLVTVHAYTPSSSSKIISYIPREINGVPTPYTPDGSPFAFDLQTNGFIHLIH